MPRLQKGSTSPTSFRRTLFWAHFTMGSVAGLVILVMALTGALMAYQRQIVSWIDRGYESHAPSSAAPRLEMGTLLAGAYARHPSPPASVTVHSNPALPVEVSLSRDRVFYFDSFSGRELGMGSQKARDFFATVESVHRWLSMSEKHRDLGRAMTGACTLTFLTLIISGLYLWWPRGISWQRIKSAASLRRNLPGGRARHWNWHTVAGFWAAAPLLLIVTSGVVMSYPWANNLLYRLTGNIPPPPSRRPSASAAIVQTARLHQHDDAAGRSGQELASGALDVERMNHLWERAENQVPGWQTITQRRSPNLNGQMTFLIDQGDGGRPDLRSQLILDDRTGETVRWEPFSSYNGGRRLRAWVRFIHTGEAGGFVGRTLAALTATTAALLVYTGLAMALRRASAFLKKRRRVSPTSDPSLGFGVQTGPTAPDFSEWKDANSAAVTRETEAMRFEESR